jgi:thioredoxin 1
MYTKMTKHVADMNELAALLPANPCIILKFSAAWCGPCKVIAPFVDQLALANPGICFVHVDVDEADDIASAFNIESMPTFVALVNGQPFTRFSGAMKHELEKMVDAVKAYA